MLKWLCCGTSGDRSPEQPRAAVKFTTWSTNYHFDPSGCPAKGPVGPVCSEVPDGPATVVDPPYLTLDLPRLRPWFSPGPELAITGADVDPRHRPQQPYIPLEPVQPLVSPTTLPPSPNPTTVFVPEPAVDVITEESRAPNVPEPDVTVSSAAPELSMPPAFELTVAASAESPGPADPGRTEVSPMGSSVDSHPLYDNSLSFSNTILVKVGGRSRHCDDFTEPIRRWKF